MIDRTKSLAVLVSIAAALVLAAAFMPLGEMSVIPWGRNVPGFPMPPSLTVHLSTNGWNGAVPIAGVDLPWWTVAPLALAAAALAWLAVSPWRPPRFLGPALASVGLIQASLTAAVLVASPSLTVGIGAPLTVAAFSGMVICSLALAIEIGPQADK